MKYYTVEIESSVYKQALTLIFILIHSNPKKLWILIKEKHLLFIYLFTRIK